MVFIESPWFDAWRNAHLDDKEFHALQAALLGDPFAGDLIRGSGGLRKIRMAMAGRGKRGGARVIYYYVVDDDRLYLLYAFAKSERADLTRDQLRRLALAMHKEFDNG